MFTQVICDSFPSRMYYVSLYLEAYLFPLPSKVPSKRAAVVHFSSPFNNTPKTQSHRVTHLS